MSTSPEESKVDCINLNKSKFLHWNLDGQGDSPNSDSSSVTDEIQTNKVTITNSPSNSKTQKVKIKKQPKKMLCRISGLSKKKVLKSDKKNGKLNKCVLPIENVVNNIKTSHKKPLNISQENKLDLKINDTENKQNSPSKLSDISINVEKKYLKSFKPTTKQISNLKNIETADKLFSNENKINRVNKCDMTSSNKLELDNTKAVTLTRNKAKLSDSPEEFKIESILPSRKKQRMLLKLKTLDDSTKIVKPDIEQLHHQDNLNETTENIKFKELRINLTRLPTENNLKNKIQALSPLDKQLQVVLVPLELINSNKINNKSETICSKSHQINSIVAEHKKESNTKKVQRITRYSMKSSKKDLNSFNEELNSSSKSSHQMEVLSKSTKKDKNSIGITKISNKPKFELVDKEDNNSEFSSILPKQTIKMIEPVKKNKLLLLTKSSDSNGSIEPVVKEIKNDNINTSPKKGNKVQLLSIGRQTRYSMKQNDANINVSAFLDETMILPVAETNTPAKINKQSNIEKISRRQTRFSEKEILEVSSDSSHEIMLPVKEEINKSNTPPKVDNKLLNNEDISRRQTRLFKKGIESKIVNFSSNSSVKFKEEISKLNMSPKINIDLLNNENTWQRSKKRFELISSDSSEEIMSPIKEVNGNTNRRQTRRSNKINRQITSSESSTDEVMEPEENGIKQELLTTPPKKTKNQKHFSSPKYSPLNVIIKSPRTKQNNSLQINLNELESLKKNTFHEFEPLKKRLRSSDIIKTPSNSVQNKNNSMSSAAIRGIGELQPIPVLEERTENDIKVLTYNSNKISEKDCDNQNQNIPLPIISASINDKFDVLCKKTPESIKKNLFRNPNDIVNVTIVEELKACSYEKENSISQNKINGNIKELNKAHEIHWKQDEEHFLNEIDVICNNETELNKEKLIISKDVDVESKNNIINNIVESEDNNIKFEEHNQLFKPNVSNIERSYIISSGDYIDLSPYNSNTECTSPEKNIYPYTARETLSQQYEKEMLDVTNNYTKTRNLTVAEKYDLIRNFAPQPSTSKAEQKIVHKSSQLSSFSFSFDSNDITDNSPVSTCKQKEKSSLDCSQIIENLTVLDQTLTNANIAQNSKIWMPKYNPPTSQDLINTLREYQIPEYRFQKPFYSDYSDVTGKIDIGHNVLKIPSTTTVDLDEFESCTGFQGLETWRRDKFKMLNPYTKISKNSLRVTLAGHSEFIITPSTPPPSRNEVDLWMKLKISTVDQINETIRKSDKIRIAIPCSPGNDNDSCDESMILSPCTPEINTISPTSSQKLSSSRSTPVSSQESPTLLRKGNMKRKGSLKRKALFSQSKLKSLSESSTCNNDSCQITGVSLDNTHGFKLSYENLQNAKAVTENQNLTILVVELHIRTRADLNPDPQYDSIRAIFYSIFNDVPKEFHLPREETGIIVIDSLPGSPVKQTRPILDGTGVKCQINYVKSELEMIEELVILIRKWDPDIFAGFEIELLSWGYLIERCYVLGINLPIKISRTNPEILKNKSNEHFEPSKEIKLTGRIILDIWRLFRHEIALQSYTFENLMYHILHRRVPAHSFKNLSLWWDYRTNFYRHITANYYIIRVEGILKLLDQLDIVGRTCELARLFGIQFYEVLSRGSQFRVESMMLRLAKPLNYIPVSPSIQQRAKMRAPEWVPLILEPESRLYVDPIIVLDFQSLYPSIIIAYNYCFSTCIGRVEKLGTNQPFDFGASQLKLSRSNLKRIQNKVTFSPCGVGFVTPEVRKGILPKMLREILETRLMVKRSMKENKDNKVLQRVLHSRQLGLKLIANVTYGYTSANFSGRMPCIEVGDSVVSKGRETLERAIKLIEQTTRWGAKVVYGDTDSIFVLVAGRSRKDAFKIGEEIADAVTNDNPPPVKLKLEKIYQPCILQTKKRYVGYKYESAEQKEPDYDAKGIETVRRDGCPAVAKMLEKTLRILFESRDMSLVKRYVVRQFEKILSGRASVQDLTFAREYRGASGYRPGACVPALELTRRWTAVDKRKEPRRGQRVPYVVVHGPPGVPLIRLTRCPWDLLDGDHQQQLQMSFRPNAVYYITRVIAPPLNRCLSLIGADVQVWYNEMPRKQLQILPTDIHFEKNKKSTISQYFATMSCVVCNNQTRDGLCEDCCNNRQLTIIVLQEKIRQWERKYEDVNQICKSCCERSECTECSSLDCPVLYKLNQIKKDMKQVPFVRNLMLKFESI